MTSLTWTEDNLLRQVYAAPIGAVYHGLADAFVYKPKNLQQTIEELRRAPLPREDLRTMWWVVPDGMGIVMVTAVSLLFDVFGATLAVFPILAVGLSAVSVACLCLPFPDSRLLVVPLHFSILTILLLSPVSRDGGGIDEFGAGSARYVSLLAILSAIHLCLEIFDRKVWATVLTGVPAAAGFARDKLGTIARLKGLGV